jgi:hypothetical protein
MTGDSWLKHSECAFPSTSLMPQRPVAITSKAGVYSSNDRVRGRSAIRSSRDPLAAQTT